MLGHIKNNTIVRTLYSPGDASPAAHPAMPTDALACCCLCSHWMRAARSMLGWAVQRTLACPMLAQT